MRSTCGWLRDDSSLLDFALRLNSRAMSHRCCHSSLLIRRQLEDVIHQQLRVVAIISLERSGDWTGEYPVLAVTPEKSRRHGRSRTDRLRVQNPALHPV